jgi:peptide deformylase
MAVREIITIPDPVLKMVSAPVVEVDGKIRTLLDDMLETMYAAPGIGLAAVQVGHLKRLVVIDLVRDEGGDREPMFFINPKITKTSEETATYEEGCLSIPDYYEEIERPAKCTVEYLDRGGKPQKTDCDGLLATVIQHEVDHLNGVLFIDYLSRLKRDRVIRKFAKQKRQPAETVKPDHRPLPI